MIATNVGRGAVDAGSADSERHESVRQRRVVLTPQAGVKLVEAIPPATVTTSPARRGDHVISRKAIAQGRPDALRWTCMLVCALLCAIAHGIAGAARTRSSLRPLIPERGKRQGTTRARRAAGTRWHIRISGLIRFLPIIIPS